MTINESVAFLPCVCKIVSDFSKKASSDWLDLSFFCDASSVYSNIGPFKVVSSNFQILVFLGIDVIHTDAKTFFVSN